MNDDSLKQHQTYVEMENHPVPVTVLYDGRMGEIQIKEIVTEGGFSVSPNRTEKDRITGEISEHQTAAV